MVVEVVQVLDPIMKSPFPGMNPYLENAEFWHDFHQRFVIHLGDEVGSQLSDGYFAKLEEQIYVHEVEEETRTFLGRPDVGVFQSDAQRKPTSGNAMVAEPPPLELEIISVATDRERESYIEIRDRISRRLVTVIELLSPANKNSGKDREQYLAKRERLLESRVHVVEIDLLRQGPRMPVKGLPICDYCVLVCRAENRPIASVWPFQVTDALPPLLVPLSEGDTPLKIDLNELFQRVFVAANYAKIIYRAPLDPPLDAERQKWAEQLIRG